LHAVAEGELELVLIKLGNRGNNVHQEPSNHGVSRRLLVLKKQRSRGRCEGVAPGTKGSEGGKYQDGVNIGDDPLQHLRELLDGDLKVLKIGEEMNLVIWSGFRLGNDAHCK